MQVILPTGSIAENLHYDIAHFSNKYNLPGLEEPASLNIVNATFEEDFRGRFHWVSFSPELDIALKQNLPWWRDESIDYIEGRGGKDFNVALSEDFYCNVLDRYILTIRGLLDDHVGHPNTEDMWTVWHTRKLGRDIVIEKDRDYRILDWENRINSGEWSP